MIEGILEIEQLMYWRRGIQTRNYIQICSKMLINEELDEWQGKIYALESKIKRFSDSVQDNYSELKAFTKKELSKMKSNYSEATASIERELAFIKENSRKLEAGQNEILKSINSLILPRI